MAKLSAIYAKSLAEMALNSKSDLHVAIAQANAILEILSDGEINLFFNHPHTKPEKKIYILSTIFEADVNENIVGLIKLAIYKNREKYVADALKYFIKLMKRELNIIEVKVNAPGALKTEQIEKIKSAIKAKLNGEVEIKSHINKRLIAGSEIAADDIYINNNVRKSFKEIELLVKGQVSGDEITAG